MNKPIEKCCLCLTTTNTLFIKLFSKSGDTSALYDKISTSLPQLSSILNECGCKDYMVCTKCCDKIQMICEFNRTCIKNVKIFTSQREFLNVEKPQNVQFCVMKIQPLNNESTKNTTYKKRKISDDDAEKICNEKDADQGDMDVEPVNIKLEVFDEADDLLLENQNLIDNSGDKDKIHEQFMESYTRAFKANVESNNEDEKIVKDDSNQLAEGQMSTGFERYAEEQQGFSGQAQMVDKNIHLRNNLGVKSLMCETCGKSFNHKGNLDAHILTHTGEKPYKCDMCNKAFTTKQNLKSHKLMHSDEKSHMCELCLKQFRHKQGLVLHTRVHTGERPYKCDLCDKAFRSRAHFTEHRRVHTGEKPFVCHMCNREFAKRKSLKNHLLKHLC